jgi:hypothetical protein
MAATNVLPSQEEAADTVFNEVASDVFFRKCASVGLQPRTRDEAWSMLNTAAQLEELEAAEIEKTGGDSFILFAQRSLEQSLGQTPTRPNDDMIIKQAASQYANNPAVFNAVLALKAAQIQQTPQAA